MLNKLPNCNYFITVLLCSLGTAVPLGAMTAQQQIDSESKYEAHEAQAQHEVEDKREKDEVISAQETIDTNQIRYALRCHDGVIEVPLGVVHRCTAFSAAASEGKPIALDLNQNTNFKNLCTKSLLKRFFTFVQTPATALEFWMLSQTEQTTLHKLAIHLGAPQETITSLQQPIPQKIDSSTTPAAHDKSISYALRCYGAILVPVPFLVANRCSAFSSLFGSTVLDLETYEDYWRCTPTLVKQFFCLVSKTPTASELLQLSPADQAALYRLAIHLGAPLETRAALHPDKQIVIRCNDGQMSVYRTAIISQCPQLYGLAYCNEHSFAHSRESTYNIDLTKAVPPFGTMPVATIRYFFDLVSQSTDTASLFTKPESELKQLCHLLFYWGGPAYVSEPLLQALTLKHMQAQPARPYHALQECIERETVDQNGTKQIIREIVCPYGTDEEIKELILRSSPWLSLYDITRLQEINLSSAFAQKRAIQFVQDQLVIHEASQLTFYRFQNGTYQNIRTVTLPENLLISNTTFPQHWWHVYPNGSLVVFKRPPSNTIDNEAPIISTKGQIVGYSAGPGDATLIPFYQSRYSGYQAVEFINPDIVAIITHDQQIALYSIKHGFMSLQQTIDSTLYWPHPHEVMKITSFHATDDGSAFVIKTATHDHFQIYQKKNNGQYEYVVCEEPSGGSTIKRLSGQDLKTLYQTHQQNLLKTNINHSGHYWINLDGSSYLRHIPKPIAAQLNWYQVDERNQYMPIAELPICATLNNIESSLDGKLHVYSGTSINESLIPLVFMRKDMIPRNRSQSQFLTYSAWYPIPAGPTHSILPIWKNKSTDSRGSWCALSPDNKHLFVSYANKLSIYQFGATLSSLTVPQLLALISAPQAHKARWNIGSLGLPSHIADALQWAQNENASYLTYEETKRQQSAAAEAQQQQERLAAEQRAKNEEIARQQRAITEAVQRRHQQAETERLRYEQEINNLQNTVNQGVNALKNQLAKEQQLRDNLQREHTLREQAQQDSRKLKYLQNQYEHLEQEHQEIQNRYQQVEADNDNLKRLQRDIQEIKIRHQDKIRQLEQNHRERMRLEAIKFQNSTRNKLLNTLLIGGCLVGIGGLIFYPEIQAKLKEYREKRAQKGLLSLTTGQNSLF